MGTETLDIENPDALLDYLRRTGRIGAHEQPAIRNLAGGVSNRTVLVERPTGEAWVVKQPLEKLRVAVDWFCSPERIHREAMGLRWLEGVAPPGSITPLVFEDYDYHVLAIQAVPQPHENWKQLLLAGRLEWNHVEQFGGLLGTIHRGAYERRDEVASLFEDRALLDSLRVEPYYRYTATQVPAAAAFLEALVEDTLTRSVSLVHGDYSPKNVLIHRGRLVLLDHEVINFGDSAFDLGFSLTHFLSKAHHLTEMRGAFVEAAHRYWAAYCEAADGLSWAEDLERHAVRHTLGCLLGRVAGRSKLEYLDDEERARQREVVAALMSSPPATIGDLIGSFVELIGRS